MFFGNSILLSIYSYCHAIFALPRHGVPYIVNMDGILYSFVGVYHCANFGTAPAFLSQAVAQNRFQS